ncbi:MAG: AAA family ATPase, partial [Pseudomonadota bacterium]|nr:AAA family ATPase [Pseudomonadota bacterium]
MYNEFFGLKENPFSISPDPQYFYMSKGHIEAFRHLLKGITE